jgi:ADP-ribose pyrophosphatase YjhB (NUDIX family)
MKQVEILEHGRVEVSSIDFTHRVHDVRVIGSDSGEHLSASLGNNLKIMASIAALDEEAPHPSSGLPDDLFYYISRTTPLVNVDLLIKDENGRTLLSWRNDKYAGIGWHVPGGIVRFKETLETRVKKVAETEIGTTIRFDPTPIALHQMIHREREVRGHFISLLYECFLPGTFKPRNEGLSLEDAGYLVWHDRCPANLLHVQEGYRKYIDDISVIKGTSCHTQSL